MTSEARQAQAAGYIEWAKKMYPAMRLTRCWPDFTQHTCNPNVIRPGETYIETPGVPVDATANHAATWMITEIFSDSHPGDPDGPGLKSLLTHDPGRIFRRRRASRPAAALRGAGRLEGKPAASALPRLVV